MKTRWLQLAACAALVAGFVIYSNWPEKAPAPQQVKAEIPQVIKEEIRGMIGAAYLDADHYKDKVGKTFELTCNAGGGIVGKPEPITTEYKPTDTIRPKWAIKLTNSTTNPQGVITCFFNDEPDTSSMRTITGTLLSVEHDSAEGHKYVRIVFYNCK